MAVIKANAYGHGMIAVARALQTVLTRSPSPNRLRLRHCARQESETTSCCSKASFLRDELALAAHLDLTLVVHTEHQLRMLETYPATATFSMLAKD